MDDAKLENFDEDRPKIGGIHFGAPSVPKGKALEAMTSVLRGESHKDSDPYNFTYVTLGEVREKSQPGIVFNWGCDKVGFGQIVIVTKDGKIFIDDECMSKEFIKEMFGYFIDEYYKNN